MARDRIKEVVSLHIDRMALGRKIESLMKGVTKEERDAINSAIEKIDMLVQQGQLQVVSARRPTRRAKPKLKPAEKATKKKETKKVPPGSKRRRKTK